MRKLGVWMENYMNDSVIEKVEEIVSIIKNSEEYQQYLMLKEKMKKNKKATTLIEQIKKIQKELVKKEASKMDTSELETEYFHLLEMLNQIPLYVDFKHTQSNLNEIYQTIKERFDDYFDQVFN